MTVIRERRAMGFCQVGRSENRLIQGGHFGGRLFCFARALAVGPGYVPAWVWWLLSCRCRGVTMVFASRSLCSVQADGIVPWYLKGSFPHGQIPKRDSCRPRHWGPGPAACRSDRTEMAQAHGSGRRSRCVPPRVVAGYRRIWLCMYPVGCFNLFSCWRHGRRPWSPGMLRDAGKKLGKHQEKAFFKKRQSGSLDPPCCHHKVVAM